MPQEALVLILFGRYVGTIRGEGFYAVNPAARTRLAQSGDTSSAKSGDAAKIFVGSEGMVAASVGTGGDKKISLPRLHHLCSKI